ncbi:MAG: Gfo/Idh/MocA family oxidoreductase [Candidatus Latescibacter sp.]|nr:Gfo/Idh/MocA family oxidoreductase [Candidatus Latescibacter sp.]
MGAKQSRRTFIGSAALAAGAAAGKVEAQKPTSSAKPKKTRATVELLNVGVIALGDNSHMNYSIWAPTINPVEPNIWPVRSTTMNITHCWDSRPELAEAFAKKYKCQAVKNYYDMVDKVDGMIFAGFNEVKWWPQLTKPYLEAGIPCYINRPFALSMKAANEIVERAKKYNAPILCTDEREYIKEAQVGRWKVEELLREKRTILGATGDNSAGFEYPQHGVHGLYFMLAILGLDVAQVSLQADGWWREITPAVKNTMHWGLLSLQYNGIKIEGVGEQTKPFVATQQQITGQRANAGMKIYYSGGWWDIMNYWEAGEPLNRLYQLFFPTVFAMQRMFETRKMQWSYDYILQKTRIFLTGFKSHVDHNGQMVRVADLPDDWEAPHPWPNWIDEKIFE